MTMLNEISCVWKHSKSKSASKGDIMNLVGLKGAGVTFRKVMLKTGLIKDGIWNWSVECALSSIMTKLDLNSFYKLDRNWYSLVGMSYYSHHTYITLHHWIATYFELFTFEFSGNQVKALTLSDHAVRCQVLKGWNDEDASEIRVRINGSGIKWHIFHWTNLWTNI